LLAEENIFSQWICCFWHETSRIVQKSN